MTKLQRMTERLQATVAGQTEDPEHLLDVLIAAWEEMHREARETREIVGRLLRAIGSRQGGTLHAGRASLHWGEDDYDELLAATEAAAAFAPTGPSSRAPEAPACAAASAPTRPPTGDHRKEPS